MAIYDCFLYNGEEELLEIRLNVLDEVVDHFVLVESDRTFTGLPKPLRFATHQAAFARFLPRITYVTTTSPYADPWENEHHTRFQIMAGLKACRPDDVILVSDVDEVPNPRQVLAYLNEPGIKALEQRLHYYFLNCQSEEGWGKARMLSYAELLLAGGPHAVRQVTQGVKIIPDGGDHWSYLMSPQQIREKLEAFSHTEFNQQQFKAEANIAEALAQGRDLYGRAIAYRFVPIDASYPAYIREHQARFAHLIKPVGGGQT